MKSKIRSVVAATPIAGSFLVGDDADVQEAVGSTSAVRTHTGDVGGGRMQIRTVPFPASVLCNSHGASTRTAE